MGLFVVCGWLFPRLRTLHVLQIAFPLGGWYQYVLTSRQLLITSMFATITVTTNQFINSVDSLTTFWLRALFFYYQVVVIIHLYQY